MIGELKVLIMEPHEVLRCGLANMIASIEEVTEWTSSSSVADCISSTPAASDGLQVDVAILSVAAFESASNRDMELLARTRTIILVPSAAPHDVEMATTIKANGYLLLPDVTPALLRRSLNEVMGDRMPLPPQVASHLLKRARGDDPIVLPRAVRLSPREDDVLDLLVAGLSNQQIAQKLSISIHGAKRHVSSILNKLNSPSRAHLVSRALQSGIVKPDASRLVAV